MAQAGGDETLSDARARVVAGYWYDERDPTSPLSLLARDGRITATAADALMADVRSLEAAAGGQPSVAQHQLRQLLTYVRDRGPRGPLPDWTDLPEAHTPVPPSRSPFPPREPTPGRELRDPRPDPGRRRQAEEDWFPAAPPTPLPTPPPPVHRPEPPLHDHGGSALDLDLPPLPWDRRR